MIRPNGFFCTFAIVFGEGKTDLKLSVEDVKVFQNGKLLQRVNKKSFPKRTTLLLGIIRIINIYRNGN